MRPVCVKCCVEMGCKKMGVPIRAAPSHYYFGDMYECPKCHQQIVSGISQSRHVSEEHEIKRKSVDIYKKQGDFWDGANL